ncbi:hypothetical protein G7Z17_g125 [Cylindrodendrum hubeiense]|uniref:Zn(2)-C6 fungal-type domain-containing protein n=1 Tax=Cylindrodendrum hubeiense TaxID=595255 RepID=A0A9P5HIC9_9HYPO|nr:hypothetical protein G7Z17_g125 [Cylindrodendrum hubeiense]
MKVRGFRRTKGHAGLRFLSQTTSEYCRLSRLVYCVPDELRIKVKCSGTQPCTFCSESGKQCAFDSKNRGRRGPRPRQPANHVPRVTQQLAPRRPSLESTSTAYIEASVEAPIEAPVDIAITPPIEATIQVSVEPVWMPSDLPRVEEIDKSDDESAVEGDDVPDPAEWKPILEQLLAPTSITDTYEKEDEYQWPMYSELIACNSLPELDLDLMCHLIELFCTRADTQFKSLLPPAQVNEQILQRTISRGLVLAICASSMRFSVHKSARQAHSADLAQMMGDEARNCVQTSNPNESQINNIRTICILVDFEANELEEYLLWYPSIFRMGPKESHGTIDQEDGDAPMSSLIWHCSAILLNRTFLPIPERCKTANESTTSLIRCLDFPEAPPLFLKERTHRCESSADAICDITQDIISKGGFFSSALVLINRLHRSSKPYNKRVVENLKLIFIVLGAVRTFYSPAQAWIDVLFRAHDINTPLSHVSGDLDLAFNSYFSRFIDIEEPVLIPLDPKESKDKSDAETHPHESPKEALVNRKVSDRPESAEQSSSWLQTYVGHLAGDIHDEDDDMNGIQDQSMADDFADARQTGLMKPANAAGRARTGENLAAQGGGKGAANMAGVMILSKGYTPFPQPPDEMTENGNGRVSFPGDMDDLYPELFSQIPSLGDFIGMGHEIPIFPGLGALMDGDDIWSDVLSNTMLQ